MKCSRCAVQTTIRRYHEDQSITSRPGRGRKRKTSSREDRWIEREAIKNRKETPSQIAASINSRFEVPLSAQTVRRRLDEFGIKARKARKKPLLTESHKRRRLDWAKRHQHWTTSEWSRVLWSDESNIEVSRTYGNTYVRRRTGEAYNSECLVPTVKYSGGSIMIWGCMSSAGTGIPFICSGRMNSTTYTTMLEQTLEPSIAKLFQNRRELVIYQQDNAPCHTARSSLEWFRQNKINVLDWPAQSPDLNPIEHLWGILKKKISTRKIMSITHLKAVIQEEWQGINPSICKQLVDSLPKRIAEVIKNKGGPTRY